MSDPKLPEPREIFNYYDGPLVFTYGEIGDLHLAHWTGEDWNVQRFVVAPITETEEKGLEKSLDFLGIFTSRAVQATVDFIEFEPVDDQLDRVIPEPAILLEQQRVTLDMVSKLGVIPTANDTIIHKSVL